MRSMLDQWEVIIKSCFKDSRELSHVSGIVNGNCGLMLLYAQLYSLTKNEYYLDELYKESDCAIGKCKGDYSLGYGLAGISWTISLLCQLQLFSDAEDWLLEADSLLEDAYFQKIREQNIDYYKGALGILFYFLNKEDYPSDKLDDCIAIFCEYVSKRHRREDWMERKFDFKEREYYEAINLGVPHGITGVLLLLLLIKEKRGANIDSLIETILELLLGFENEQTHDLCHFPSAYRKDVTRHFSTIGWCYGDLMIGYAALKAGILLHNSKYVDWGMNILTESTYRDSHYGENLVLCHGFTSLSHVYHSIYTKTGNKIFEVRSSHWRNKSLSLFEHRYQKYKKEGKDSFFENPSLFFGVSGFFLSLISWERNEGTNDWMKCLLL